jgi:predicted GNAT family N-acyltransferase
MMEPVAYEFIEEDDDFHVIARINGMKVGHAWGDREGNRLLLGDVRVEEVMPQRQVRSSWFLRLFASSPPSPVKLRGKGIGKKLLEEFLRRADTAGVEIWGNVMPDSLEAQPFLLGWYARYGFVIEEPDGECMKGAAKKIVRRR